MAKTEVKRAAKWKDVPCYLEPGGNTVCCLEQLGALTRQGRNSQLLKEPPGVWCSTRQDDSLYGLGK